MKSENDFYLLMNLVSGKESSVGSEGIPLRVNSSRRKSGLQEAVKILQPPLQNVVEQN
jgi:hypothetical protein